MNFKQVWMQKKRAAKPKGWSTLNEIASEMCLSRGHTSKILNQMERDGRVIAQRWIVYDSTGRAGASKLFKVAP